MGAQGVEQRNIPPIDTGGFQFGQQYGQDTIIWRGAGNIGVNNGDRVAGVNLLRQRRRLDGIT